MSLFVGEPERATRERAEPEAAEVAVVTLHVQEICKTRPNPDNLPYAPDLTRVLCINILILPRRGRPLVITPGRCRRCSPLEVGEAQGELSTLGTAQRPPKT